MKKKISLIIRSLQYAETLEPSGEAFTRKQELENTIEIRTDGTMYEKGEDRYICYEESEEAGLEDARTVIKVSGDKIEIRRYRTDADDNSVMLLQKGCRNIIKYKIPMVGALELDLFTNDLRTEVDEEGFGVITADYKLRFDQFFSRRNVLEITVKSV